MYKRQVKVFNFEVEDFHTYFVGESHVLVHNACGMTNKEAAELAKELGFEKTNYLSSGKKVFYHPKKKVYITVDRDSHNGGVWKVAKTVSELGSKTTRMGTYDKYLNRIGD